MTSEQHIRVGITHGDINGIGYEIILKTLQDARILDIFTPIVYGSPKIAAYHRKALNIQSFNFNNIKHPDDAVPKRANLINILDDSFRVELGKPSQHSGLAAYKSIEQATDDLVNKDIDVLVTAPINKHNIQSDKFTFPGHTEYLAQKSQNQSEGLMLMLGENLRIAVLTGHIPLRDVANQVTKENILTKLQILQQSLVQDFRITAPRIAVLGLNPHAGDRGLIGVEEVNEIIPAIEVAQAKGMNVYGPYPADGLMANNGASKFDAVLAMYHDQGLAPFKAIEFEHGVNYTAGLSFIRTSPAHGTAFEISGKGVASPNSFRQALYTAVEIFQKRNEYEILTANTLKKQSKFYED